MIYVLEGIDGSGKTFALNWLTQELRNRKIDVIPFYGNALIKGENPLYNISNILNFGVGDIKHLIYLAQHINAWEDILYHEKQDPNTVIIKDRGWLTVLTYLLPDVKINYPGLEKIVKEYLDIYSKPVKTFCLMLEFSKDRINHRYNMKEYYSKFDSKTIYDEYWKRINEYKEHQNIEIFTQNDIEGFKIRNNIMLKMILNNCEGE